MACGPVRREHVRLRENHAALFQCAAFYPDGCYSEAGLHRLCEALFSGEAGHVLRVKGTLRTAGGLLMLNATQNSIDVSPCGGEAVLNVIGHHLRRRVIRKYLSECAGTN